MKKEDLIKANRLLEELNELLEYKKFLQDSKRSGTIHFEFVKHYGHLENYDRVAIPQRYNHIFTSYLDKIIEELEDRIDSY